MSDQDSTSGKPRFVLNNLMKGVIVILLGAIGSGLWAGVGSPFFGWIRNVFIYSATNISSTYLNHLHSEIGKGFYGRSSLSNEITMNGVLVALYIAIPIVVYRLLRSKKVEEPEDQDLRNNLLHTTRKRRKILNNMLFITSLLMALFFIPFVISNLLRSVYTSQAILFTERSIEILSPYIEDREVLMLRSDFRSVNTAVDFYSLEDKLREISSKEGQKLPDFSSFR